jgi:RecA-family ATPase
MQSTITDQQLKLKPEKMQAKQPRTLETAADFLKKDLPKKEALIEGLLYRRDLVTLAGRRRHGKTALVLNLAMSLADPYYKNDFLGYRIAQPRRVLVYLLEDDAAELQDRLRVMLVVCVKQNDVYSGSGEHV